MERTLSARRALGDSSDEIELANGMRAVSADTHCFDSFWGGLGCVSQNRGPFLGWGV